MLRCDSLFEVKNKTCIDLRWVVKWRKTCVDLNANLIPTKLKASHHKSSQVLASPGQTETQVDASF